MGGVVWIASYPRSGNTWIRAFLHSLLNITGGKEELDLNSLAERSTWDIAAHWYEPFLQKSPDQVTKEAVAAARPLAQQRIADSVDGLVFVKTHAALVKDRGTPTIDMTRTAGAIYVVRNPLDVAISYAKHLGMPIARAVHILNMPRFETDNFPTAVYEFYGSWSQHVASWTRRPHRAVFIVRYEDLLADPLVAFGRMAEHLHIEASAEQIGRAVRLSSFERLSALEAETGFREKPADSSGFFRKGTVGQWRNELPPRLIEQIVGEHGETMRRFGYLP
jgi:hypothetical protein